jgi:hypothetical protein
MLVDWNYIIKHARWKSEDTDTYHLISSHPELKYYTLFISMLNLIYILHAYLVQFSFIYIAVVSNFIILELCY